MGLTSCRRVTITESYHSGDAVRNRHDAGCRVGVERAANGYTFICDLPRIRCFHNCFQIVPRPTQKIVAQSANMHIV
jgi:hypothetical protein